MSGSDDLTYAGAGVDIDAGNEAVKRIRGLVDATRRPEQLEGLGGFAGLFRMPAGYEDPVLCACTDGVGTKLLVAIASGRHDTVGIDLVAMNVNDLLVTGAEPLFVLDYIATGRLDPAHVEDIVRGIAEGCRQSGAALLGGETAELPGMYADGHYDLAATAVGVVDQARIWGTARVQVGDAVLGLASSGLHSNGYSLARRALLDPEHGAMGLDDPLPGSEGTVADALMIPTRIYAEAFAGLRTLDGDPVRAAVHVTGGGLIDNPPRVLGEGQAMALDMSVVPLPPVLAAIRDVGVSTDELRRTFNCGVGMLVVVDPQRVAEVRGALEAAGEQVFEVGSITARAEGAPDVTFAGA